MARYLISFNEHAMDHIPEEEMTAVAEAAHAVVKEAQDAGVWVFAGGMDEDVEPVIVAGDGTVTAGTYPTGRHDHHRRALTGGSLGVGGEDRGRLPLCAGGQRVRARSGCGQLMAQSLTSVGVITLYVEDQQRSKEFYERVFEVAAVNEEEGIVIFKFDNLFLRLLTRVRAETELLGQVPLADSDSGASFQLAIFVDDADALCADLAERGVSIVYGPSTVRGAFATRASATRTATSGRSAPTSPRTESRAIQPRRASPQGRDTVGGRIAHERRVTAAGH